MEIKNLDNQYKQLLESKGIIVRSGNISNKGKTTVMFPGHGSQYSNMLFQLRNDYEPIKHILDKANDIYLSMTGKSLTSNWTNELINEATILQPSIYTANMAMYNLLKEDRISGDYLIGHSLGEISALVAADTMTFEEGFRICYHRAKSLDKLPTQNFGKMISIKGNPKEDYIREYLSKNTTSRISIINSPSQFVISATDREIESLKQICEERQITYHVLPILIPFHTPLLKEAADEYYNQIKDIKFLPNKVPVYSTILERFYNPEDFSNNNIPKILSSQLITPFDFDNCVRELYDSGARLFIECGPKNILSKLVNRIIDSSDKIVASMNLAREDERLALEKFKAKITINMLNKQGRNNIMNSTILDIISKSTGYPKNIIDKHISQSEKSNFTNDLAISPETKEKIIKHFNEVFPSKKANDLNSIILNEMSADTNSFSKEENKVVAKNVEIENIITFIKKIISEKTGYPVELLDENADLEADLGIDSVKQAEVIGKVREYYGYEPDENVKLKDYPSILLIGEYVVDKINCTTSSSEAEIESIENNNEAISLDEIIFVLKEIISEKTGYPTELLELEADLEADLGIDSVKQAEIIGKIRNKYEYELDPDAKVKDYPNIKLISEYVLTQVNKSTGIQKKNYHNRIDFNSNKLSEFNADRYSAKAVSSSILDESAYPLKNKNILLITDPVGKISEELASDLQENNKVAILSTVIDKEDYIDFSDSEQLTIELKKAVNKLEHVDCIINLQALYEGKNITQYSSISEFENDYKCIYNGLFYSSKVCYSYFENNQEAAYFAATSIGDYFGVEHNKLNNLLGAITTGFIKAIEKELRPFIAKVVDIENLKLEGISNILINEFSHFGNFVEIGYVDGIRKSIITVKDEFPHKNLESNLSLNLSGDSILVSGGGRGITFECTEELLSNLERPMHVYLTGRTPEPLGNEEWIEMSDNDFENYKHKFMTEKKKENPDLKAIEIMHEYQKLQNGRELYKNLNKIRKSIHTVEYIKCDFSKVEDVKKLHTIIQSNDSDIMGIINGAGLPSFGKVPRKNESAAYKVLQLKANSMYLINKYFLNNDTGFVINMGSISGRFGMDGQVDYSAAADLIVKLNKNLSENYKNCKFLCVGWSAWESVGMASSKEVVKVQKEERGLSYISVEEGRALFVSELYASGNDKCEYLYFGQLGEKNMPLGQLDHLEEKDNNSKNILTDNFLLIDKVVSYGENYIKTIRKLDIEKDQHLKEHKVDGNSVLAGVYHIEMVCEVFKLFIQLNNKENFIINEIKDYEFNEFIKYFKGNPLTINAHGEVIKETKDEIVMKIQLESDFINKKGVVLRKNRLHSGGIVSAGKNTPKIVDENSNFENQSIKNSSMKGNLINLDKYYEIGKDLIYFGHNFRNISSVFIEEGKDHITGRVKVTDEDIVFNNLVNSSYIINPIVIDNIGRLMLLNEFDKYGYSIVPTNIENAEKIRDLITGEVLFVDCFKISEDSDNVIYDANAYDKDNKIVFVIKNMNLTRIGKLDGDYNLKVYESTNMQ